MTRQQQDALDQLLRNGPLDVGGDPAVQREVFTRMLTARPLPDDVTLTHTRVGGVPTLQLEIMAVEPDRVLLWFHGGFYVMGSARASAGLASDVARRAGASVVSVDYRLAPEHPYPAALEDAIAAYRGLLEGGVGPDRIAVVGESAGGGLALAMMAALGDAALPQPAAGVLFSPYADLSLTGASMIDKAHVDPAFTRQAIAVRAADYLADADPADPGASPINADLRGLPPLLIQVGTHELLLDDAIRVAARAAADDVAVTLEVTPHVPHLFQAFAAMLDDGDTALSHVSEFLHAHLDARLAAAA